MRIEEVQAGALHGARDRIERKADMAQERFDTQQPGQYSVAYEEPDGTAGRTEPVAYADTEKVRTALEVSGVRVTGVVKKSETS